MSIVHLQESTDCRENGVGHSDDRRLTRGTQTQVQQQGTQILRQVIILLEFKLDRRVFDEAQSDQFSCRQTPENVLPSQFLLPYTQFLQRRNHMVCSHSADSP